MMERNKISGSIRCLPTYIHHAPLLPNGYVNAHIPINDSLSLVGFLSDIHDIHFYKFNICIGHLGNYLNQQHRTLSNFSLRQIHQQAVFATLIF